MVVGSEPMTVFSIAALVMTCVRIAPNPVAHVVGEKVSYFNAAGTVYEQLTGDVEMTSNGLTGVEAVAPAPDTTAPPAPTALTVLPGYKGFGASFAAPAVPDLMFSEIRYAPTWAAPTRRRLRRTPQPGRPLA